MLDKFNRYLAVAFIDAESVKPNKQERDEFVETFKSLNLLAVGVQSNKAGNVEPRVGFISPDGSWRVLILGDQFHVTHTAVDPLGEDLGPFNEFAATASQSLAWLIRKFNRIPHRLGLVREALITEKAEQELDSLANRLLKLPQSFNGKSLTEWDWRASATFSRQFAGLQEETNTIITIKRGNLEMEEELTSPALAAFTGLPVKRPVLRVDLDVNTRQDNTSARFQVERVEAFFQAALEWQKDLENEVERLIERG
jgi:hypothetical protein